MSVSSVASSSAAYTSAIQQQASAVQKPSRDAENDGDKDDGVAAVKTPAPSVNLNGQTVGSKINVAA